MTTLTVLIKGAKIVALSAKGHAGYAQEGHDIVCSAVSILFTTCVNALETIAKTKPLVQKGDKETSISFTLPQEIDTQADHDAQIILRTVMQGYEDIAREYPKYFELRMEET